MNLAGNIGRHTVGCNVMEVVDGAPSHSLVGERVCSISALEVRGVIVVETLCKHTKFQAVPHLYPYGEEP
jgi:hypothetical protein